MTSADRHRGCRFAPSSRHDRDASASGWPRRNRSPRAAARRVSPGVMRVVCGRLLTGYRPLPAPDLFDAAIAEWGRRGDVERRESRRARMNIRRGAQTDEFITLDIVIRF